MSAPMRGGDFNPRTPRGVRQYAGADLEAIEKISIHAPREGCDYYKSKRPSWSRYFNPRTPRGVRRGVLPIPGRGVCNFNPRTPRGVRRLIKFLVKVLDEFQSTHPARGATLPPTTGFQLSRDFNPRTPRGVRQQRLDTLCHIPRISIHAPREGCDSKLYQRAESLLGSICLFAQGEEG